MLQYKTRLQYKEYSFTFGGKNSDTLASLRYAKFMQAVATWAILEPETLLLTERAVHFNLLRVHIQVCQWKYLKLYCLKSEEWVWTFVGKVLKPIKTNLQSWRLQNEDWNLSAANVNQPQKMYIVRIYVDVENMV